ncbi:MAG: class I SAM-dependent methyltransferase [Bacteroidota bacterium]
MVLNELKIEDISNSLVEIKPGLWTVRDLIDDISYPEINHEIQKDFQQNSFWYTHRSNCLKELLRNFPSSAMLDIGGSNGQLTIALRELTQTVLMEPGETGIRNALASGLRPVIHASLQDAQLKNDSLPAAGIFDVLEHIEDDLSFLNSINDALEPGGRLYISVPAFQLLWSDFDTSVGHYRRYSKKTLTKTLKQAGFEVEFFSYMFYALPVPMWLFRKIFRRTRSSSHKNVDLHKSRGSFIGKILRILLSPELGIIKSRKSVPLGSSCICVAKKLSVS